jgi:outer membrane murein-binding lipoprotein Lpp
MMIDINNGYKKEVIMKKMLLKAFSNIFVLFACLCVLVFAGCEGSDAKKKITDTVHTLVGGEVVKKGEDMKKQVDQAMKEEAKRLIKMDKENKAEGTDEGSGPQNEKGSDK